MKADSTANLVMDQVEKIIIGKRSQLELIMAAVLSGGHVLLDDLPGSGKTTLVKALSKALGCQQRRIQFTPDLLPADVVGTTIFNQKTGDFETILGPVHTNILLADEINRAIPRTQSALLEAMEERQVTIEGKTYELPRPFFVMATQNPVEKESTFPLPAAEMDRFFIKLSLGFPSRDEELKMLDTVGDEVDFSKVQSVTNAEEMMAHRAGIAETFMSEDVKQYIVDLVQATRSSKLLRTGGSPRATRSLFQGGKALAAIRGRSFVTPKDIQDLAVPVLAHRITLTSEARYSGNTAENIVMKILEGLPVPPAREKMF